MTAVVEVRSLFQTVQFNWVRVLAGGHGLCPEEAALPRSSNIVWAFSLIVLNSMTFRDECFF